MNRPVLVANFLTSPVFVDRAIVEDKELRLIDSENEKPEKFQKCKKKTKAFIRFN